MKQLVELVQKRRKPKLRIEADAESFRQYLYGRVPRAELEAAVHWEHARLHKTIRQVAAMYKATESEFIKNGEHAGKHAIPDSSALHGRLMAERMAAAFTADGKIRINSEPQHCIPDWIFWLPWAAIVESRCFPDLPWLSVPQDERKFLLALFRGNRATTEPLTVPDVRLLAGAKVLEAWGKTAIDTTEPFGSSPARARYSAARLGLEHVVFMISYGDGKDKIKARFAAWIERPTQKRLLSEYHVRKTGRDLGERRWKQALREIVVRSLAERASVERARDWTETAHYYKDHKPVPFPERRSPASGKQSRMPMDDPAPIGTVKQIQAMIRSSKKFDSKLYPPD